MPILDTYTKAFRDEVARLARKEAKSQVAPTARELITAKNQVVALKQMVYGLEREVKRLSKLVATQSETLKSGGAETLQGRFGGDWDLHTVVTTRQKLDITQAELALLLGVSIGAVSGWETGRTQPRTGMKERILELAKSNPQEVRSQVVAAEKRAGKNRKAQRRGPRNR